MVNPVLLSSLAQLGFVSAEGLQLRKDDDGEIRLADGAPNRN